jgi:hypothetical protein
MVTPLHASPFSEVKLEKKFSFYIKVHMVTTLHFYFQTFTTTVTYQVFSVEVKIKMSRPNHSDPLILNLSTTVKQSI